MEDIVVLSRSEWASFIEEHQRFTSKYELILDRLHSARLKLEAIRETTALKSAQSAQILMQLKGTFTKLIQETEAELGE